MSSEVPVLLALSVALLTLQTPDADGLTPLMRAAAGGDTAAVTTLVAGGGDVNTAHAQFGLTPLMFAAYGGHDAMVRLLLERGATPNAKDASGASAADWASQGGHAETASVLGQAGAQLNPFLNVGVLPFGVMDTAAARPPGY